MAKTERRSACYLLLACGLLDSMTEDPEDVEYGPARLWGQWQLQSFSISNGDGPWPVGSPGVKG